MCSHLQYFASLGFPTLLISRPDLTILFISHDMIPHMVPEIILNHFLVWIMSDWFQCLVCMLVCMYDNNTVESNLISDSVTRPIVLLNI